MIKRARIGARLEHAPRNRAVGVELAAQADDPIAQFVGRQIPGMEDGFAVTEIVVQPSAVKDETLLLL